MIGGTTYEEARTIALLNQELATSGGSAAAGTRLLLGGTCVHNSSRSAVLPPLSTLLDLSPLWVLTVTFC